MIKQLLKRKIRHNIVFLGLMSTAIMPNNVMAHDFESNGVYYNIIENGVQVTFRGSDYNISKAYKDKVTIPTKVLYQGVNYPVIEIGNFAFHGCSSLTGISIPSSIVSIGKEAFWYCSELSEVAIPSRVKCIGEAAFYSCENLKSLLLSEGLEVIERDAFSNCKTLEEVILPSTLKFMGHLAFMSCYKLKNVTILSTPEYFGANVFGGCYSMPRDSAGNLILNDGKILCYLGTNKPYNIPESVEIIGGYAIGGNPSELNIPDKVRFIGEGAINCSYLKKLTIGEGLETIDGHLFTNYGGGTCPLEEITIKALTPPECLKSNPEGHYAFDFYVDTENCILYVDRAAINDYKNANQWNKFKHIYPFPGSGLIVEFNGRGSVYNKGDLVVNGTEYSDGELKLFIIPESGYKVQSITLNDKDIIEQLQNNILTIDDCSIGGTLKIIFAPENEAKLTVKGHESHSISHYYIEGTQAKIDLNPESGWTLYSLSFNGEDVTENVIDNTYTTPVLLGDNSLEIVMKSDMGTSVEQIENARRKISFRKDGHIVEILNLKDGETISIFNTEGVCEYHGNNHIVTLSPNNVYILSTQNETLKFTL